MANSGYEQTLNLLDHIERGLTVPLPIKALEKILAHHIIILESIVHKTVEKANLNAQKIDRVIYVGGSSMMTIVLKNMKNSPNFLILSILIQKNGFLWLRMLE